MRASAVGPWPHRLGALLLGLALTGCATVSGTRQVISIDSEPRGLEVRDTKSGEKLGTTPVFAKVERRLVQSLELSHPAGESRTYRQNCRYDWQTSLLGNTPLLLLLPPLSLVWYAGGLGTDLVTGAAFECPRHVVFENAQAAPISPAKPACASFLVIPPRHPDEKVSDFVATQWAERVRGELRECDRLVELETGRRVLDKYGISHRAPFELEKVRREHLNEVGHQTGASHLVVLGHERDRDLLSVRATVHDLHRLRPVSQETFVVDVAKEGLFQRPAVVSYLVEYINLLPNGLGFSPSSRGLYAVPRGDTTGVELRDTDGWFSSLATAWTLTSVENPKRYGRWKLNAELSPAFAFAWYDRMAVIQTEESGPRELESVFLHGVLVFGPQVIFHTPLGAFSSSLRMGPGFGWMRAGEESDWSMRIFSQFDLAYVAFPTENFFIRLAYAVTETGSAHIGVPQFAITGWNEASVTLGFHLPEIYSLVREVF